MACKIKGKLLIHLTFDSISQEIGIYFYVYTHGIRYPYHFKLNTMKEWPDMDRGGVGCVGMEGLEHGTGVEGSGLGWWVWKGWMVGQGLGFKPGVPVRFWYGMNPEIF